MTRPEIIQEMKILEGQILKAKITRHPGKELVTRMPSMLHRYDRLKSALQHIDNLDVPIEIETVCQ